MAQPILAIQNLTKSYPNGVQALRGVSFEVHKGEFVAVIGLSGSGKSTLLRCLNRLQDPSSGKILFEGKDVASVQGEDVRVLRRNIGMIFQHFNLVPRRSALSNVLTGRLGALDSFKSIFGLFSDIDRMKALEYLQLVGIGDKALVRVDQLSGGQQQRVAIARSLAQEPSILLADEPVASLDPATSHVVMDYLKKVNQELGLTVICNLHFLSLVRRYATRVIALKEGQVIFQGTPQEINEEWLEKIYGAGAQAVDII